MTTYAPSPLIAAVFDRIPEVEWSDGATLFDPTRCLAPLVWPDAPRASPAARRTLILTNQGRHRDADARCRAIDTALRFGVMNATALRDFHGYRSVKSMMNALYAWRKQQEEAP